jgi:hypothetical protein
VPVVGSEMADYSCLLYCEHLEFATPLLSLPLPPYNHLFCAEILIDSPNISNPSGQVTMAQRMWNPMRWNHGI